MTTLKIESVPISSLRLDPDNARAHDEQNLAAIRGSLERFGQVKPIVVTSDGLVLAGNGMLTAATDLGWKKVSVVRVPDDWDKARRTAFALADNRTGELAEWDAQVLAEQLVDLDSTGWDLAALGFPTLTPPTDPGPGGGGGGPSNDGMLRCPSCGFTWQDVKGDQA